MAFNSDCLIEICNTHTITFDYQTHFFSQFTFKLQLAWNVFDCLLWGWRSRVMMVNIGTGVAPMNIALSTSRTAALIERKMLKKHNIICKTPSLYIERNINPSFYIVRRPCLSLNTLHWSETTLKPGLFEKIYHKYVAIVCWHSKWVPARVQ